jgi:hypothetical protein
VLSLRVQFVSARPAVPLQLACDCCVGDIKARLCADVGLQPGKLRLLFGAAAAAQCDCWRL